MNKISLNMQLRTGKVKNIGIFESIRLKQKGTNDGNVGLPKIDVDEIWNSPQLEQEKHAYRECCEKMWGKLQISTKNDYAEVNRLSDLIDKCLKDIDALKIIIGEIESKANSGDRKAGEENLTESQVSSRRLRESSRETQNYRVKIEALRNTMDESYVKLIKLRSRLLELNNAMHLICEKIKNHSKQRVDVYWRASFETHKEQDNMPAMANFKLESDAEERFMLRHENITKKALQAITLYENYNSEDLSK